MVANPSTAPPHERLRSERLSRKLTQAEVAAGAGLSRETVTRVEAGNPRYVTTRVLILIADFLGERVSSSELLEVAR
jgi:transcriptional regulator with XRE-family HTH domain